MGNYLKLFDLTSEYLAYINSFDVILPNVSLCKDINGMHYIPIETRVVAKYNVTSTTQSTRIASDTSSFSKIEIDGVEQSSVTTGYTFDTLGEHTVKYTLADPTSIGERAFENCSGITSINIPSGVTTIDDNAFRGCDGLTSIEIPSSATGWGDYIFYNCTGLTSVTIPTGVTTLGYSVFQGCAGLVSITIPSSVTTIYNNAFRGCTNLTSIEIPSGLTSIGSSAFGNCPNLTSITVDSNNTKYDSRDNCNAIIETATNKLIVGCNNTVIPSSVTSIGDNAFDGCSNLTSIEIPSSVTSIGSTAFRGCNGLTSINIPVGVTSLKYGAFSGCTNLTSIEIPSGLTSIGSSAFGNCPNLTSITVDSNNTKYDSRNNCNAIIETATNKLIVGCNNTVIPNGVTTIGSDAFIGCSNLTSIEIPNSVTTIYYMAFEGCSSLTSIEIPSSVTTIYSNSFNYCSSLTSITVDSNNTKYDSRDNCNAIIETATNKLFAGCNNTVIPNGVTTIEAKAFWGCTGLTSIEIPSSMTKILQAFRGCTGLTSIEIPSSVTLVDTSFENCTGLISVVCMSTTPPTMYNQAFYNNAPGRKIYVPASSVDTYKAASGWSRYAADIVAIQE